MKITFKVDFFKGREVFIGKEGAGLSRKYSEKGLLFLLESLVNVNRMELRRGKYPPLYRAGVVYQREPKGSEVWKDCANIYRDGYGDCEDLAAWRIAELRNNGKKAQPYIRYRVHPVTGAYIYHVMVMRPSGLEDPSKILGMGGQD